MHTHLIWMIGGFIALLIVSKFVGVSFFLLLLFFCIFMMGVMILGMGGGPERKG